MVIESEYVLGKALLSGLTSVDFLHSVLKITLDEIKQVAEYLVEIDNNYMRQAPTKLQEVL